MINQITKRHNDKSTIIDSIKIDNIEKTSAKAITNGLGKYFSTIGTNLATKIGPSNKNVETYIDAISRNQKSVFLSPCTETEIKELINKIPNKISHGYDGLLNAFLKDICDEIVKPLTLIINRSLSKGVFPEAMKHAEVVPLHKGSQTNLPTNYRPISLLLTISKLLEKAVYSRIYSFLNIDQIYKSQYGFRSKHSCSDAILELTSNIVKGWERNEHTIALFIDFSKHSILWNMQYCIKN